MNYRANLNGMICLFLLVLLVGSATGVMAQAPTPDMEERVAEIEETLKYDDFTVKAYRLTVFGGNFSGAKYLELPVLADRTRLTDGAGDIIGFDGEVLPESRLFMPDGNHFEYESAHKEIESGPAYGAKVGIYISDDFHLDLMGTYASGRAVTTMMHRIDETDYDIMERVEVDEDDGFNVYKGGLHLMYDARPATFFGIMPRLGFGLGAVLNRYSFLEDKSALYLEGNFGLSHKLFKNVNLTGQVDLTSFAFQVDDLGYSNMVNYTTFSLGISWLIDVVPEDVRAAHLAELEKAEEY
jgi:hypothetical protein